MLLELLASIIKEPCFDQLRTKVNTRAKQRNQIFNKFKWPAYVNLDSVLPDQKGMEVESEGVTEEVVVKMLW